MKKITKPEVCLLDVLADLLDEAEEADTEFEPIPEPLRAGDRVVADLSGNADVRALFSLKVAHEFTLQRHLAYATLHGHLPPGLTDAAAHECQFKAHVYSELFWKLVHEASQCFAPVIGIRTGFLVTVPGGEPVSGVADELLACELERVN